MKMSFINDIHKAHIVVNLEYRCKIIKKVKKVIKV